MALGQNEVKVKVTADTGDAERDVGGVGGKLQGMLKPAALGAATAIAGIGIASVKMGLDFEKGMAEVFTLLPKLSKEGFQDLKTDVLDLSKEMGIATDDVVPALYAAISAGVEPAEALGFIETNARLAIGGVTDLATAVDLTTTVINAFGLETKDAADVSDILFTGVRLGKTTIDELGAAMFNVAPAAAAANVGVDQVTAALAALTASGVPTSVATTSLRQAFVELGKEGTNVNKAFTEIAGVGFRDFMEAGGNLSEVMAILQQAADNTGLAVSDLFGSVEAGGAIQILAAEDAAKLGDALEAMGDRAGSTDDAFQKMEETASRKLQKAMNELKVTMTEIGVEVLPPLVEGMQGLLDVMRPLLEVLGPTTKAMIELSGALKESVGNAIPAIALWRTIKGVVGAGGEAADEGVESFTDLGESAIDAGDDALRGMGVLEGAVDDAKGPVEELHDAADDARKALFDMFREPTREEQIAESSLAAMRLELFELQAQTEDNTGAENARAHDLEENLIPAQEEALTGLGLQRDAAEKYAEVLASGALPQDQWTQRVRDQLAAVLDMDAEVSILSDTTLPEWRRRLQVLTDVTLPNFGKEVDGETLTIVGIGAAIIGVNDAMSPMDDLMSDLTRNIIPNFGKSFGDEVVNVLDLAAAVGAFNAKIDAINVAKLPPNLIPFAIPPAGLPFQDLHSGGDISGPRGRRQLIVAEGGERILSADDVEASDEGAGGGVVIYELHLHGPLGEALADMGLELR